MNNIEMNEGTGVIEASIGSEETASRISRGIETVCLSFLLVLFLMGIC